MNAELLQQVEIALANLVSYQSSGNSPSIHEYGQARRTLEAVRATQSPSQSLVEAQEPDGYQMRRYYRDVGDVGWGIWHSINKDEYHYCVSRKDEDVETRLVYAAAPRGLPLTPAQIKQGIDRDPDALRHGQLTAFCRGVRFAEKAHGIPPPNDSSINTEQGGRG